MLLNTLGLLGLLLNPNPTQIEKVKQDIKVIRNEMIRNGDKSLEALTDELISSTIVRYGKLDNCSQGAIVTGTNGSRLIYLNSNLDFSDKYLIVILIHEYLHIVNVCGNDRYRSRFPVCKWNWNKNIYHSSDISNEINYRLKNYLKSVFETNSKGLTINKGMCKV